MRNLRRFNQLNCGGGDDSATRVAITTALEGIVDQIDLGGYRIWHIVLLIKGIASKSGRPGCWVISACTSLPRSAFCAAVTVAIVVTAAAVPIVAKVAFVKAGRIPNQIGRGGFKVVLVVFRGTGTAKEEILRSCSFIFGVYISTNAAVVSAVVTLAVVVAVVVAVIVAVAAVASCGAVVATVIRVAITTAVEGSWTG
jgi:hypothetical protein